MTKLVRADILLKQKELANSREKAADAIKAKKVFVNKKLILKPSTLIDEKSNIIITSPDEYVSRGGKKLEWAIKEFNIGIEGKVAIDVGASTGGFTDCLLKNGARKVIAVDVGYGQLDYKLRKDTRVEILERTNIRYVKKEDISELGDIATIDVSFISLEKVLMPISGLLKDCFCIIALVKPQFEASKKLVGKGGIIRDSELHKSILKSIAKKIDALKLHISEITFSPVKGADGNIEYFYLINKKMKQLRIDDKINNIVELAHEILGAK